MWITKNFFWPICFTLFLIACNSNNFQQSPMQTQNQSSVNSLPIPLSRPSNFDLFCVGESDDSLRAFYGNLLSQATVNKVEISTRYSYAITGWSGRGNFVIVFRYEPGQNKGSAGAYLKLDAFAFDYSGTDYLTPAELKKFKNSPKWVPSSCYPI